MTAPTSGAACAAEGRNVTAHTADLQSAAMPRTVLTRDFPLGGTRKNRAEDSSCRRSRCTSAGGRARILESEVGLPRSTRSTALRRPPRPQRESLEGRRTRGDNAAGARHPRVTEEAVMGLRVQSTTRAARHGNKPAGHMAGTVRDQDADVNPTDGVSSSPSWRPSEQRDAQLLR